MRLLSCRKCIRCDRWCQWTPPPVTQNAQRRVPIAPPQEAPCDGFSGGVRNLAKQVEAESYDNKNSKRSVTTIRLVSPGGGATPNPCTMVPGVIRDAAGLGFVEMLFRSRRWEENARSPFGVNASQNPDSRRRSAARRQPRCHRAKTSGSRSGRRCRLRESADGPGWCHHTVTNNAG